MSTLTDAEMIASMAARLAQLTASLATAEETIRTLRQQGGAAEGRADADPATPSGDNIDMDQLAKLLVARLKTAQLLDLTLWTTENIAAYLNCSVRQVTDRHSKLASFPRAIRLPTADGHKSNPRWKAAEVVTWAERHQDKKRAT